MRSGEISLEGRPPDPEAINDIADKRVVHRVLEHRLGDADAFLVQHRRPPAPASPLSGRREARPGVFDDQFTLKLIESGRDMEEQSLNSYSRQHSLYTALKAFGWII